LAHVANPEASLWHPAESRHVIAAKRDRMTQDHTPGRPVPRRRPLHRSLASKRADRVSWLPCIAGVTDWQYQNTRCCSRSERLLPDPLAQERLSLLLPAARMLTQLGHKEEETPTPPVLFHSIRLRGRRLHQGPARGENQEPRAGGAHCPCCPCLTIMQLPPGLSQEVARSSKRRQSIVSPEAAANMYAMNEPDPALVHAETGPDSIQWYTGKHVPQQRRASHLDEASLKAERAHGRSTLCFAGEPLTVSLATASTSSRNLRWCWTGAWAAWE
jgi:hypothetical protein